MKIIPCAWKTGTRVVDGYIVQTHLGNGGKIVCGVITESGEFTQAEWNDLKVRQVHDQPEALLNEILYKRPDFNFKTPEGDVRTEVRVPAEVLTPEALAAFEPPVVVQDDGKILKAEDVLVQAEPAPTPAPAETPKPTPRVSRRSLLNKDK